MYIRDFICTRIKHLRRFQLIAIRGVKGVVDKEWSYPSVMDVHVHVHECMYGRTDNTYYHTFPTLNQGI